MVGNDELRVLRKGVLEREAVAVAVAGLDSEKKVDAKDNLAGTEERVPISLPRPGGGSDGEATAALLEK